MAIFTTVVSCLTLLTSPQTPPQSAGTPPDGGPFVHANAFSRSTPILLSWDGGAAQTWQRGQTAIPAEVLEAVPRLSRSLASQAGLTMSTLEAILGSRISLGITSLTNGEPSWLAIAELGEHAGAVGAAIAKSMGKPFILDAPRPQWLDIDGGHRIAVARTRTALLVGTDENVIADAIRRILDGAGLESLATGIRFRRFIDQCGDDARSDSVVAAAFCDISTIVGHFEDFVPGPQQEMARTALEATGLSQMFAAGYIANEVDGLVHEHTRVCFPEPRTGPLTLLTGTGAIDSSVASFVPDDAGSFAAFHLDIPEIFNVVQTMTRRIDPDAEQAMMQAVEGMSAQFGINLRDDILPSFGRRIATMDWSGSSEIDAAAVIELTNPVTIAEVLRKLPMFEARVVDGFELFEPRRGDGFTVAIGEGNLVVASSNERMQAIVKQAVSGAGPKPIRDLLASAPRTATAVTSSEVGAVLVQMLQAAQRANPEFAVDAAAMRRIENALDQLGVSRSVTTVDPEGLSMRSHSKLGLPGIAYVCANLAAHQLAPTSMRRDDAQHAAFSWRLTNILESVKSSGSTDLALLAREHGLSTNDIGSVDPQTGQAVVDGYRIKVFGAPSSEVAIVAWPDAAKQGDVFACTSDGVPLVNPLLTQSAGIEQFTLRDLFLDGQFDNQMMTGWQPIVADVADVDSTPKPHTDPIAVTTPDSGDPNVVVLTGPDWATYQSILAVEAGDLDLSPEQIAEFLNAANPMIVSRAAQALGKLGATASMDAVAHRLTQGVEDQTARRQLARTLAKLGRDRASETTMQCMRGRLDDDDAVVRALAAEFCGMKRDTTAVSGLVSIMVREPGAASAPDRAMALLSLVDIGDPSCLKRVMGCPVGPNPHDSEALAYLFQELSSKLDPQTEVSTLMSVLDHDAALLRRYSIQRLGELQDKTALGALEKRLGAETDELRPLVDVSIAAIRGPIETDNTAKSVAGQGNPVIARAKQWFSMLGKRHKNMVVAGATGGAVLFLAILFLLLRRPRASEVDWAAMTGPSDSEYAEQDELEDWGDAEAAGQEGVYQQDGVDAYAEPPFEDQTMAGSAFEPEAGGYDSQPPR